MTRVFIRLMAIIFPLTIIFSVVMMMIGSVLPREDKFKKINEILKAYPLGSPILESEALQKCVFAENHYQLGVTDFMCMLTVDGFPVDIYGQNLVITALYIHPMSTMLYGDLYVVYGKPDRLEKSSNYRTVYWSNSFGRDRSPYRFTLFTRVWIMHFD